MKHDSALHRSALHPLGCRCRTCHRTAPSDARTHLTANEIAGIVLVALATSLTAIQLYAWSTGSPGVPAMFGL